MKQRMLLFSTVALCSCVFLIYANKLQAQTPVEKLQRLSQALNLSPQQKTQLLPILEGEAPKIEAIKNNPNLPPGEKAMQLREIHQQADPQVQSILTAQQYKEWQTIRSQEIQQAIKK
jgi:hypothetical protein